MERPVVSILIPCFNDGPYLSTCLESIEGQKKTFPFEIIIINDGSSNPETLGILKSLAERGITVLHQQNKGLGAARNLGILQAKGKYILPLDADNKLEILHIPTFLELLESNEKIGAVYGNAHLFEEKSGIYRPEKFNLNKLLAHNYIDACALFRKQVFDSLGGYDEKMPFMGHEDWEMWIRMGTSQWEVSYLDVIFFYYRVRKNSMIHEPNNTSKHNENLKYLISKYFGWYKEILSNFHLYESELGHLRNSIHFYTEFKRNPIKFMFQNIFRKLSAKTK